STSSRLVIPRSGRPWDAFATPAPERYKARNPARWASTAAQALIAPTICSGRSAARAARNRVPGDCGPGVVLTGRTVHRVAQRVERRPATRKLSRRPGDRERERVI